MTLSENERIDLIKNYIEKSDQSISDAELLIENKRNNSAVNRIYYSIFYIISALALKKRFSTSKHTQLLGWFNKNFIKEYILEKGVGKIVREAFEKRMKSDYDAVYNFSNQEVKELIEKTRQAINDIKRLLDEK